MTLPSDPPAASDVDREPAAHLPVVLLFVGCGIAFRLAGAMFFSGGASEPFLLRHCLAGLGLQSAALVLALRRRDDAALFVTGADFAWIALATPRFGSGSMLFLLGLIHPFLVLVMTRWSVRVRIVLALVPPASFAMIRFSAGAPMATDLLTPEQLRHLATATVLVFIVLGVTASVHALRTVERSRRRAEELAEERSRLIDDMSHELRTPVATVLTAAQSALARERTGEAYRDSLRAIERQARALGRIIHRMLELSRAERGDVTVHRVDDLVEAVRRSVDSYRDLASERSVELQLDTGPVEARTDAAVLHIVLGNLLSNAICFSPEGGRVFVRVDAPAARARITVRDHGPGIAPEDMPRIFDRYWRADKARSRQDGKDGLGLGLPIARLYARWIGATIEAASELGQGATFTVSWER